MAADDANAATNTDASAQYDRITIANQHNSPLLRLPAELRNKIYTYICVTTSANITSLERLNLLQELKTPQVGPSTCVALLTTCRQVNREVSNMFFSLATFYMCDGAVYYPEVIGNITGRELITTVELDPDGLYCVASNRDRCFAWLDLLPSLKLLKVPPVNVRYRMDSDLDEIREDIKSIFDARGMELVIQFI